MRVFGYSSSFGMKSMNRIGTIIDNVEFSVFIKKSVSALDVSFGRSLFVSELAIVSIMNSKLELLRYLKSSEKLP